MPEKSTPISLSSELLDDDNQYIPIVSGFMSHLHARDFSPNTQAAYAYDLLHFMSFLKQQRLTYLEFTPMHALDLLAYLRAIPSRRQGNRLEILCDNAFLQFRWNERQDRFRRHRLDEWGVDAWRRLLGLRDAWAEGKRMVDNNEVIAGRSFAFRREAFSDDHPKDRDPVGIHLPPNVRQVGRQLLADG